MLSEETQIQQQHKLKIHGLCENYSKPPYTKANKNSNEFNRYISQSKNQVKIKFEPQTTIEYGKAKIDLFKLRNGEYENLLYIPKKNQQLELLPRIDNPASRKQSYLFSQNTSKAQQQSDSHISNNQYKFQMNEMQYCDYISPKKNMLSPLRVFDSDYQAQIDWVNQKFGKNNQSLKFLSQKYEYQQKHETFMVSKLAFQQHDKQQGNDSINNSISQNLQSKSIQSDSLKNFFSDFSDRSKLFNNKKYFSQYEVQRKKKEYENLQNGKCLVLTLHSPQNKDKPQNITTLGMPSTNLLKILRQKDNDFYNQSLMVDKQISSSEDQKNLGDILEKVTTHIGNKFCKSTCQSHPSKYQKLASASSYEFQKNSPQLLQDSRIEHDPCHKKSSSEQPFVEIVSQQQNRNELVNKLTNQSQSLSIQNEKKCKNKQKHKISLKKLNLHRNWSQANGLTFQYKLHKEKIIKENQKKEDSLSDIDEDQIILDSDKLNMKSVQ